MGFGLSLFILSLLFSKMQTTYIGFVFFFGVIGGIGYGLIVIFLYLKFINIF